MDLPKRKQNRLKQFDYGTSGYYFITLCTNLRQSLFEIERVGNDLCVVPPLQNQIIHKWVKETENKFQGVRFEKYVIMPDHLHFIINITQQNSDYAIPEIMKFFKTMTTNDYIKHVNNGFCLPFDKKLWQKSYYDHIIRNREDYNEKYEYVENNPTKWMLTHTN